MSVCFQIEVELIFHLNPNLAPAEPQTVIPSKLSRVSDVTGGADLVPGAPGMPPARGAARC